MRTALYFGSFNPIHKGHTAIAAHLLKKGLCDRVLFIVSPQSPFKEEASLINEQDRLAMVRLALTRFPYPNGAEASDIEFTMPHPSWTIDTLRQLRKHYPTDRFYLLMGEDNLTSFARWKEPLAILKEAQLLVYPRIDDASAISLEKTAFPSPDLPSGSWRYLDDAPRLDISSTHIREAIRTGSLPQEGIEEPVATYIQAHKLYGYPATD